MLDEVKKSLEASPIVKKGDYNYFVNPISDGVPAMDPKMLRELSLSVYKHADLDIDKIVAVEAMGIHLATALSLATDIPFVVIRKRQYGLDGETQVYQKTGYGSSNLFINDLHAGERILLIDDVVSTGGTLIALLNTLDDLGLEIKSTVAVIEKGEGKEIVERETGHEVISIVKLDVIDGKVVIEKTIED
ncbi:MAG: purine phosphoribosyltransferase family protein [Methanobrevibacter sp.]|uniref:hypoxanthine/guanine phosphoribosyltransferase n=1 Tax=Methanobrevibacter sp. TaxID=66852 RepID=UPI0025DAE976|nr:hypoxanthine/guanine phosphoribosyltransferase [Methanobrevibacter sp.]MBE6509066.1 purine phosphoribosyltransferase family protein [Methanobrevibacter sp.]